MRRPVTEMHAWPSSAQGLVGRPSADPGFSPITSLVSEHTFR